MLPLTAPRLTALPLDAVLREIGQRQSPLPPATSALVALAAVAAVGFGATWQAVRHLQVMAHEAAHALVGSAAGMRVTGVRLRPDASGETTLRPGRGGDIATTLAGYLGPSLFGLGVAGMIFARHPVAALWLTLILLVALLLLIRNLFGALTVLLLAGGLYAVARYAPVTAQVVVAYLLAWLLLLSGVRNVLGRWAASSDAIRLAQVTAVGPRTWAWLWLTGASAALALGGYLLL